MFLICHIYMFFNIAGYVYISKWTPCTEPLIRVLIYVSAQKYTKRQFESLISKSS